MTLFHEHTGKLRTWARRTLWFCSIVGVLCAIVVPIFLIYRKEGADARSAVDVEPQGVSHTGDFIHVVATVSSVDFDDKNFRVHFEFTPHGTLAGDDGILTEAIEISLFYTTLNFPDGQIMRSIDVTMPYTRGAPIDYPFDRYVSYFEVLIHKEFEKLHKVPVSFTFLATLQTVEFIPVLHLDPTDTYKIAMQITTNRSPTTIGFSLFVVVIMWALSISIGIITIQVVRKHRESDEHILTLGITTLFALPALRETQPGIPAIGCAADVLGFYWNMAIIAIASICVLLASALRWKEPSLKRELELIRMEHSYQSRLINEMTVPMPFPLTGGPFTGRQYRKKRVPFMMNHQPPPSPSAPQVTPRRSPPSPSSSGDTKRRRGGTRPKESEDDHWSFSDRDDDLSSLRRLHQRQSISKEQISTNNDNNNNNHPDAVSSTQGDSVNMGEQNRSSSKEPLYEQPDLSDLVNPSSCSTTRSSMEQHERPLHGSTDTDSSSPMDEDDGYMLLPVATSETPTKSSRLSGSSATTSSESLVSSPSAFPPDTATSTSLSGPKTELVDGLRIQDHPRSTVYHHPLWNESSPVLPLPTGEDLQRGHHFPSMNVHQRHLHSRPPLHPHRLYRPSLSSQSPSTQSSRLQTSSLPAVTTTKTTTNTATIAQRGTSLGRLPRPATGLPESKKIPTRLPIPSQKPIVTSPLKETTPASLNASLTKPNLTNKPSTTAAYTALSTRTRARVRGTGTGAGGGTGGEGKDGTHGGNNNTPKQQNIAHRGRATGIGSPLTPPPPSSKAEASIVEMEGFQERQRHPV